MDIRNFGNRYTHGLRVSARNNASAYGYSVTVTAGYGIISALRGTTGILEIFAWAGGAVLAFTLVGATATSGFRQRLESDPSEVQTLAGALAFVSVGLALVATLIIGWLVEGLYAWPLGSFLATVVYLGLVPLEMVLAEVLEERRAEG